MELKFRPSESTKSPVEVDTNSSKKYVYLRKNIHTEEKVNEDGSTTMMFKYDEAYIDKDVYYRDLVDRLQRDNDQLKEQLNEQANALIELASLVG